MKVKPRHFPHPVLSDFSDDYNSEFEVEILTKCGANTFDFDLSFGLNDQTLIELINNDQAKYMVHLECSKTWTKIVQKTKEERLSLSVYAGDVHDQVDICVFIIATENIYNYYNSSFHSDYGDQSFSINKGDILAIGPHFLVDIEKEPIRNINSIFQLEKNNDAKAAPMTVFTDSNKIVVTLSAENYSIYSSLKQNPNSLPLFHTMIAVPALAEAIETIKRNRDQDNSDFDNIKNFTWYKVIEKRLIEIGEDIENPYSLEDSSFEVSQKLIDYPLTKALKYLENSIFEGEENVNAFE